MEYLSDGTPVMNAEEAEKFKAALKTAGWVTEQGRATHVPSGIGGLQWNFDRIGPILSGYPKRR